MGIFYHYTARQLFPKIEKEGISKCVVPWTMLPNQKVRMMHGLQWLTLNPDFDEQTWAEPQMFAAHRLRKSDMRIAVSIPRLADFKVVPWVDFARHHNLKVAEYFETFADHTYWRVFQGLIPPKWIMETVRNPTRYEIPQEIGGG